jgi:hypothetical protein
VQGKMAFEWPPEHADGFRREAKDVTHLLIIGWRAAEPHALEALKEINPGYHLATVDPHSQQVHDALDDVRIDERPGAVPTIANRAVTRTSWPSFEALLHLSALDSWLDRPVPWPGPHDRGLTPWT